jgi:ABC-type uncharacterized transport system substrate-binding protein
MKKIALTVLSIVFALSAVSSSAAEKGRKKVLYIDSYHEEYIWSADITAGIRTVLDGREDVELKIHRMDTKRNQSEEYKKQSALDAKTLIETWKPDVVIASDDNASKYLISPYFKNADLPFVFCGLNWDASTYDFPARNVTGMIEVALYQTTIDALETLAKGRKVGYLASDTVSERKELENIQKRFDARFNVRFAKTFPELKQAFLDLQEETDMVLIQECRSVQGFDHREMVSFVRENTSVPTGAMQKYLIHYALITFAKVGEEQGEYAAKAALEILAGKSPQEMPVVANKKAKIYLNMKLAKRLNVKFPMELIQSAHLISAEQKKLLFVNSYHKGFKWSDDIEKGILKALNIKALPDGTFDTSKSEVELRVFRMDTKLNKSEAFKKQAALSAKAIIDEWQPDIVVTSDDNAAKYLIVPYYRNSAVPFVFCGVSWDASDYGFPASNVTGMVEVAPIPQIMELLERYAKGDRLGFIGSDNLTSHRDIEYQKKKYGLNFSAGKYVSTFDEWKKEYLRLQSTVDMIMWTNPIGIEGWDNALALEYILGNTTIPSAGTSDNIVRFALLGRVRIAEEQGWWSGKTALRILEGADPADIPIVGNKESRLYLNMELAKRMNIKFPMELIEEATFLEDQPD